MTRKRQQPQTLHLFPQGWDEKSLVAGTASARKRSFFNTLRAVGVVVCIILGFWTRSTTGSEAPSCSAAATGGFGNSQAKQMLRVAERLEGNVIHFVVENLESVDVTATFDLGLVNLRGSTTFPFTTTFGPHQMIEAFSLAPVDESREWHFSLTNAYTLGSSRAVHDDSYAYSLPYAAGLSFLVSQADDGAFSHSGPERHAIDWKMPEGTPVLAARAGVVVATKDDSDAGGADRRFENCANYILIQHRDGTIGNYAHLLKHGVRVRVGQTVDPGSVIGLSGNTGFSSGPHLHFSVFKARDGRERASIPIRFLTDNGVVATLVSGKVYRAPQTLVATIKQPAGQGF